MHPGNDSTNLIMIVYIFHELRDAFRRRHDPFAYHFIRQSATGIKLVNNSLSILSHVIELLFAIQELTACYKPKFIICCFQHQYRLLHFYIVGFLPFHFSLQLYQQ